MDDFDQVKNTVRAILISAKNGLTPQQLQRDYESIVGVPLPVRELGFGTVIDLVASIPNVVRIERSYYGGVTLRAIPNSSCRHVANLVSKQRSNKRYNSITRRDPPQIRTLTTTTTSSSSSSSMTSSHSGQPSKEIPLSFKIKLRQLMISYPNGLVLSHFQEAFQRRFGYYVNPAAWGYLSIATAIRTLTDIVQIIYKEKNGVREKEPVLVAAYKAKQLKGVS